MVATNYNDYSAFIAGQKPSFTFAKPDEAAKSNPQDKNAATTEYRTGIFQAAKNRINQYSKTGKMNFEQYLAEQKALLKKMEGDSVDAEKIISDNRETYQEDFNSLDINTDGFIDEKETANELNYMDYADGDENGTIERSGFANLWGKTSEEITNALKKNYKAFNNED